MKTDNFLQRLPKKWKMHMIIISALFALPTAVSTAQDQSPPPLDVVPAVDLNKYAGVWYEIARLPNIS